MSANSNVTPANEWKQGSQGIELTVPSGKVCLARRASIATFMQKGIVPNPLLKIVIEAAQKDKPPSKLLANLDRAQIDSIFELYDAAALYCVIQPRLTRVPPQEEERDNDMLYVDEVDLEDKAFIFQWAVGGTADIEQFRAEMGQYVVALSPSENMGVPPKPTS